jgi:hypothetical protein
MEIVKEVELPTEQGSEILSGAPCATRGWFVPLMLLGISGYLFLNLFRLPNIPILLSGDQVYFWMNGQRMLNGERPYVDFFQFTPPGADVFYFGLFKLFGPRIWTLNFTVLALGTALCWVCFKIAEQIMERHLALLSTLLFVTLVYTRLLNATHHYFSVLAIMGATAVLMHGISYWKLGISGALLGLASFFTQTHGVAALLAITVLMWWERSRTERKWGRLFWGEEGTLVLSFACAWILLSAPFIASVGLKQLWYFQVIYVRKAMVHGPETHLLGMPEYSNWRALPVSFLISEYSRHIFVYAMLPVAYFTVLIRCRKQWVSDYTRTRKIALLGLVGAALCGELIFSLNWLRLYTVSMAGIILLVWIISTSGVPKRYVVVLIWTTVAALALGQTWSTHHGEFVTAELPAGKSAVAPQDFEKLSWGTQHTSPGEFLFQASWPGLYIPLGLRNPVFLDTASTMLNPEWAERAAQQLEAKKVPYVIWAARLDYAVDPRRPRTANIVPLRSYLKGSYRLAKVFGDGDEAWERK